MSNQERREQDKERLLAQFAGMYEELYQWRAEHPAASFDEIANQVTPRRQELMGALLSRLALQYGSGEVAAGFSCEQCGQQMGYKGKPRRGVEHLEGEARFKRAYYYCAHCEGGLFPPGPAVTVGQTQLESGDDSTSGEPGDSNSVLSACGAQFPRADQNSAFQE